MSSLILDKIYSPIILKPSLHFAWVCAWLGSFWNKDKTTINIKGELKIQLQIHRFTKMSPQKPKQHNQRKNCSPVVEILCLIKFKKDNLMLSPRYDSVPSTQYQNFGSSSSSPPPPPLSPPPSPAGGRSCLWGEFTIPDADLCLSHHLLSPTHLPLHDSPQNPQAVFFCVFAFLPRFLLS